MKIYIGTNKFLDTLKILDTFLKKQGHEIFNLNNNKEMDIFDISVNVAKKVVNDKDSRGIIIDEYGNGGFIIATKIPGTIVAQIADEHSSHMTRDHNNTNIITIGSNLTAIEQIKIMVTKYLNTDFSAGRHLVRTDMLDEMLKQEEK